MALLISTVENIAISPGAVVPAFNGPAERFVLRALRLFRRSLRQVDGDAGKVLGKHLRARVPSDAVDDLLGDLTSLFLEIQFLEDGRAGLMTRGPSRYEFFLIALIEASQRGDTARATESAIALLDTFQVRGVLEASTSFAQRLEQYGLHLMPIGDAAFNYFADYKPLPEPVAQATPSALTADAARLRLVASGAPRRD